MNMSIELILLALAVICMALALHPFITYPLSLMLLKKLWPHRPKAPPARKPGRPKTDDGEAFAAILDEWTGTNDYVTRIGNLHCFRA